MRAQVSAGFRYAWSAARPAGDRGDGFTVLRQGTDRLGGDRIARTG